MSKWQPLYNTARWKAIRAEVRRKHKLCALCERLGKATAGTTVDHKTPHRGNRVLFFDPANVWLLCGPCHDSIKQSWERNPGKGCDVNGNPLTPRKGWE